MSGRKRGRSAPDSIDARVGSRIKARRLELGLSQSALADRLGVSFQQVQKYENGKNRVGAGRLTAIADFLKVQPSAFFEPYRDVRGDDLRGVDAFVASKDGMHLMRAMAKIKKRELRRQIAQVVEDIVSAYYVRK